MKIYVDAYYVALLPQGTYERLENCQEIPGTADAIAFAHYTSDLEELQNKINRFLPKTDLLIVSMIEAVTDKFKNFLLRNNNPKIKFFLDSDMNFVSPNTQSITCWFMCSENLYVTVPQLKQSLAGLVPNVNKPMLFDCLLGKSKFHRDQIENHYLNSKYQDRFIFTYYKGNLRNGKWDFEIPDHVRLSSDELSREGVVVPVSAWLPVSVYNQTYYSIVAETMDLNTHNQYTEKLAKPLLARRLFVAFAGQYYLKNLKNKGFMTFDTIIDESYDNIANPFDRYKQAWMQVERLCEMDPAWVVDHIKHIVDHNQRHFLETDWQANLRLTLEQLR